MRKRLTFAVALLGLVAALLLPASASAATSISIRGNGIAALAVFHDVSGCTHSEAVIAVVKGTLTVNGNTHSGATLLVTLFAENTCNHTVLLDAHAERSLSSSQYLLATSLTTARVDTTVHVCSFDNAGQCWNGNLAVYWRGAGNLHTIAFNRRITIGDCSAAVSISGAARDTSASGSATLNGTHYSFGLTNNAAIARADSLAIDYGCS